MTLVEEKEPKPRSLSPLLPPWLRKNLLQIRQSGAFSTFLRAKDLPTICVEAKCPNHFDCWAKKHASFLLLGTVCTRSCGFCDVSFCTKPAAPSKQELILIRDAIAKMRLKSVVLTMVSRDDLEDGGAEHMAEALFLIKEKTPQVHVELLVSDFAGRRDSWKKILDAAPDIISHNIETVAEISPKVRHKASYERSMEFLAFAAKQKRSQKMATKTRVKTAMMLGLGESVEQVQQTLHDLQKIHCEIVIMGQYLQPNAKKLAVKAYIPPKQFDFYAEYGRSLGLEMHCGPFMRSSSPA